MKMLHMVAFTLLVVGGVNWGLMGLMSLLGQSSFNLVNMLLGSMPMVENFVYTLVGVSAVYLVTTHAKDCRTCKP